MFCRKYVSDGRVEVERQLMNMKNLICKQQVLIGIVLIVIGNVLAFILHKGLFANITWVLYGLILILNPVYPERYSNDVKKQSGVHELQD